MKNSPLIPHSINKMFSCEFYSGERDWCLRNVDDRQQLHVVMTQKKINRLLTTPKFQRDSEVETSVVLLLQLHLPRVSHPTALISHCQIVTCLVFEKKKKTKNPTYVVQMLQVKR